MSREAVARRAVKVAAIHQIWMQLRDAVCALGVSDCGAEYRAQAISDLDNVWKCVRDGVAELDGEARVRAEEEAVTALVQKHGSIFSALDSLKAEGR